MPFKMKALKSFGVPGSNEGKIRRGREFEAKDRNRMKDLEANGLAYRIEDPRTFVPAPISEVGEEDLRNEAAEQGPFDLAGGETGAQPPAGPDLEDHAPSSRRGRRQRKRRSED